MKRQSLILILLASVLAMVAEPAAKPRKAQRLKVGLVLGGGGAKGAAEVGVLKVIEETGIPIDYIAGTSIGSIVGGLYSCGYRSAQLDSMFCTQEWVSLLTDRNDSLAGRVIQKRDGVTYILGFPIKRKKSHEGVYDDYNKGGGTLVGDSIVALLDRMTGRPDSISFDQLPIPFRCVATDVNHMQEVVLSDGRLSVAMRSSMAIPGAFKPIRRDSMLLVDGGTINNLPVDVVRRMGADVVIAVDLTQNKRAARNKKMRKLKGLVPNLIQWANKRPDLQKYNTNRVNCEVYINPELKGYSAADFKTDKIRTMIQRGEEAGEAAREQILALKKQIYTGKK